MVQSNTPCLVALAVTAAIMSTAAHAQAVPDRAAGAPADRLDEVVVTGTRATERTQFETLAPVDVLPGEAVRASVSSDLNDVLAQIVPSFNVQRLPMADGQVFVRPATLRSLSPDQTLVLLNGKRFHRSALIGSRGAQGADLSQIPTSAIGRVEVLRDGASAQYGSDAIAGVVNIVLDEAEGFAATVQTGQYFEGDGLTRQISLRGGTLFAEGGRLSASAEWNDQELTSRSRQRPDAIVLAQANPQLNVPDPVQRWGQPDLRTWRASINGAMPVGGAEAYGFGTAGQGSGKSDFNWRNPVGNAAIYGASPAFPGFDLRTVYPAGFTPRFGSKDQDYQFVAGMRGEWATNLSYDFSASLGRSAIEYTLGETINASLGPASPTSFDLGELTQKELNFNADFVWSVEGLVADDSVTVAFGFESREETYGITAGEPASYAVGPGAAPPARLAANANGFPGFAPDQAGEFSRSNLAAYVDLDVPVTDRFRLGLAGRYEDYDDFGGNFDYKLGARYEISEGIALRATLSTGFRAPTPGQQNTSQITQGLDVATLSIFTSGRVPPGVLAGVAGLSPAPGVLSPETSDSLSFGLAWRNDSGLSTTLDAYRIDVKDRFSQTGSIAVTPAIRAALVAGGIPGAVTLTRISYFTNDYETRTEGVDLVGSYVAGLEQGRLTLSAGLNYNETTVLGGVILNPSGITTKRVFEEARPKLNATASAVWQAGAWEMTLRARHYGPWLDVSGNSTGELFQEFGSMTLADIAVAYAFNDHLSVKLGAENALDRYPAEALNQANRGLIYSRNAPYDTDGGQYYLRLDLKF
jgi:iron complex outermembrane receptor protein